MDIGDFAFQHREKKIGELVLQLCNKKSLPKLKYELEDSAGMLPQDAAELIDLWIEKTLRLCSSPNFWKKDAGHLILEISSSAREEFSKHNLRFTDKYAYYLFQCTALSWAIMCKQDAEIKAYAQAESGIKGSIFQQTREKVQLCQLYKSVTNSKWKWAIIAVLVLVGLIFIGSNPQAKPIVFNGCECRRNVYNCDSFPTQTHAQLCFNYCMERTGHDVHFLDMDNDGFVCEPYAP